MWYIYAVWSYTGEHTEEFMDSMQYGGRLGDFAVDMLDLEIVVNDEENKCGFEDQRKEPGYRWDLLG